MTEDTLPLGAFTGLKVVDPTLTDWKAGGESGISGAVLNASSDWRAHLPVPKCQLMKVGTQSYGDTESCTNFSITNDIATYLQFLIDTNQMPAPQLTFLQNNGYIVDGKVNLSPRFSAITSGTTGEAGNSLPQVWQTARTVGLVPDADCPFPTAQWAAKIATGNFTIQDLWAIWFDKNAVTPAALAKAKQFVSLFQIQYQWVSYPGAEGTPASLKQSLQTAPLQLATAVCSGWNTDDPIKGCGAGTQHATTMTCVEPTAYDIFDHYNPYQKQFALDYVITYAMQGVVVPISTPAPITYPAPVGFKHTFTVQLDPGATGTEVVALQNALKVLGFFPLTVQSTGNFVINGITESSLQKFQAAKGIASSGTPSTTGYGRLGPATMKVLNSLVGA